CRSRSRFSSLLDLALRDLPSFPTRRSSDLTKTKGHKRCLTVGGVQGVYFVLQRLEGIVALFDGTRVSVTFGVRDVPLFCGLAVFVVAGGDKRCQHFIDTVNGGAAINMTGDLSNNLRCYRGCRRDRLRWFNLGVTHLK